jgi:superfamily II DNA or RNA helicase
MSLTLRPYQQKIVEAVKADWAAGYTDLLVTAATGSGKTAIFLWLLNDALSESGQMTRGKRGLILAHRKELIEQPLTRLFSYFPEWRYRRAGVVMADQDEPGADLVVATVQTLASSPKRLERILAWGPIDYLVVDEAHHFTDKNTYHQVYRKLKEANPRMLHLGVTATPIRADGDGLAGVYQKESAHYGIKEGIEERFLAPVRWLAIEAAISLKGVKVVAGEFQRSALGKVFETDELLSLVAESYRQYASERQAVAFTVTVDGAYRLASILRQAGVPAEAADGTTDKRERARILDSFAGGSTKVLCNVGLYTEGLDVPQASCILMARPTRSDGLYVQCIGRALRTYPGKEDALILDFVPVEKRNIVMAGDVLGIPLKKREALLQAGAETERGAVQAGFTFDGQFTWMDGSPVEILSRQLDYLDLSPWSWYRRDGWLSLGLGKASDEVERTLLISPPVEGEMVLYGCAKRPGGQWQAYELARGSFDELSQQADEFCNKWGNAGLAAKQRAWRRQPPTDKQLAFARRIKGAFRPGMTKGELAQSITHHLALRTIQGAVVMQQVGG